MFSTGLCCFPTVFRKLLRLALSEMCFGHIMILSGATLIQDQTNRLFLTTAPVHSKKRTTCSGLMKTGLTNVLLPTLFKVVNNTEQVDEPELACNQV